MSEDLEYRIAKLNLSQGDVLVVQCNEELRHEQLLNLRQRVTEMLGDLVPGVRTLVIDSRLDLSVLTRQQSELLSASTELSHRIGDAIAASRKMQTRYP